MRTRASRRPAATIVDGHSPPATVEQHQRVALARAQHAERVMRGLARQVELGPGRERALVHVDMQARAHESTNSSSISSSSGS